MKKIVLLIMLVYSSLSWSVNAHTSIDNSSFASYNSANESGELVIGIPNFNQKRYDEVMQKLNHIPGIRSIEYCKGAEVFLITYDVSVYVSSDAAFRVVNHTLSGMQVFYKHGANHNELKKKC